jgi:PAS domain S-box-containing protein
VPGASQLGEQRISHEFDHPSRHPGGATPTAAAGRAETGFGFPEGSVFRASIDAVIIMGEDGRVRDWNPAAEQLLGYRREEAIGREVAELIIPGPLRSAHRHALARYLETGETTILERRVEVSALHRDGSQFPVELSVTRLPSPGAALFAAFVRDLKERSRTQRENLRLQERMAFLAQAGLVLDSSLEFDETLHRLAEMTVPGLAQIAVIDLLEEGGLIKTAIAAAVDPAQARAVERMRREHPLGLDGSHPVARVLRSGRAILEPEMSAAFQRQIAEGPEHFELMRRLRYHSAIVVPLVARRRALGALSLLRLKDTDHYDENDLVLAEELARRAALAVDNARLFEATRNLARTLQRSLLPHEFPPVPGVRVSGRYRAAAQGQEVGGDFYDVFTISDRRWGMAIGDVCGKGPEAASLTSLVRYTLRALAEPDAADALRRLNERVMRDPPSLPEELVTVLFAAAWPSDDDLLVELATAGHPPPLLLRSDGSVERPQITGPLIGLTRSPQYHAAQVRLRPRDALLMYTDGLTDARAPARILDETDLIELLRRSGGRRGDDLTEFLEREVTGGGDPRDDIAMLVVEREG